MLKITEIKKEEAVQALELIHEVYREIPEKSWFSLDGDKELLGYMTGTGFALKAVEEREVAECRCKEGTFEVAEEEAVEKKSEMAAVFIARTTDLAEENLGEYLRLTSEEMERVAHMEIAMVRKAYRGQGVQKRMMEVAEQCLKEQGYHYLMGTAHPENVYSVNNFKKLGYEIVAEDLKYGGLPRYIFCKEI